jgi:hypothetical protein
MCVTTGAKRPAWSSTRIDCEGTITRQIQRPGGARQ